MIFWVVSALLLSAWGNVIAAAFCARFEPGHDGCGEHAIQARETKPRPTCHHEMAGMARQEMPTEPESERAPSANSPARSKELRFAALELRRLDLPLPPCTHCSSQSQRMPTAVVVSDDHCLRMGADNFPPADFAAGMTLEIAGLKVPSEHSPPGAVSPRFLVMSVFRI